MNRINSTMTHMNRGFFNLNKISCFCSTYNLCYQNENDRKVPEIEVPHPEDVVVVHDRGRVLVRVRVASQHHVIAHNSHLNKKRTF